MKYRKTRTGIFLSRPNRFIANVEIEGKREVVHVKNTGRCGEIFLPGARVILEESENLNRKTRYDLVAAFKEGLGWVNVDSQAPNKVVREWLERSAGEAVFPGITYLKPEYSYGKSRVDFYLEYNGGRKVLMEVKGVTLERERTGYFPDAPTERGVKHLRELTEAVEKGYECFLAFVIQMEGVELVYPNGETHPEFQTALEEAEAAGVKILYFRCNVEPDALEIAAMGVRE